MGRTVVAVWWVLWEGGRFHSAVTVQIALCGWNECVGVAETRFRWESVCVGVVDG